MGRLELEGSVDKATRILAGFVNPKYVKADKQVPATLLRHCEGIAFITIVKAGLFFLGGNLGSGCVLAKIKDEKSPRGWRWSGPVAVGVGGLGGGFIFGAEKIDSMIILRTQTAVRAFMGDGQVTFGANVSLAVGPVGREAEAHVGVSNNKEFVAAYSYSVAQGLYIGGTLEGAILLARSDDNKKFYNDPNVTATKILSGEANPPLCVDTLHRELYAIHDKTGDYAGLESSVRAGSQSQSQTQAGTGGPTGADLALPSASGTELQLAPNWRKVFTADGKAYYHNTVTNETAWEAPVVQGPPKPVAPALPAAQPAAQPVAQLAAGSARALPGMTPATAYSATPVAYPAGAYGAAGAVPAKTVGAGAAAAYPTTAYAQTSAPAAAAYGVPVAAPAYPASARPAPPVMPARPPMPVPTAAPAAPIAVALYDYNATRPDELTFKVNDRLTVLDKTDANWFKCTVNGQTGLAPSNYLRL
jgi:lipid-binding SYLF domain-containing protein